MTPELFLSLRTSEFVFTQKSDYNISVQMSRLFIYIYSKVNAIFYYYSWGLTLGKLFTEILKGFLFI